MLGNPHEHSQITIEVTVPTEVEEQLPQTLAWLTNNPSSKIQAHECQVPPKDPRNILTKKSRLPHLKWHILVIGSNPKSMQRFRLNSYMHRYMRCR